MNTDIRVAVDFWEHPKTLKLIRQLGVEGPVCLQRLWMYAAKFRPDGILLDLDILDIADAGRWGGDPERFVRALLERRWLDQDESGAYLLHDWNEHQPWAIGAPSRSEAAKKAGKASAVARRNNLGTAQPQSPNTSRTERSENVERPFERTPERLPNPTTNRSTPSPSPTPTPKEEKQIPSATDVAAKAQNPVFLTKKKKKLSGQQLDAFEQFWNAFAYKRGKAEAGDVWLAIPGLLDNGLLGEIVEAAKREAQNRPKIMAEGRTPKMAQGWLAGRRWEDDLTTSAEKGWFDYESAAATFSVERAPNA